MSIFPWPFGDPKRRQVKRLLRQAIDLNLDVERRREALAQLQEMGPVAVPYLLEGFRRKDEKLDGAASLVLCRMGDVVIPQLIEALGRRVQAVRASAGGVLLQMMPRSNAAREALLGALGHKKPLVVATACLYVGEATMIKDGVPRLIQVLAHPNLHARHTALGVLAGLGPLAVEGLHKALSSENQAVSEGVALALQMFKDKKPSNPVRARAILGCGDCYSPDFIDVDIKNLDAMRLALGGLLYRGFIKCPACKSQNVGMLLAGQKVGPIPKPFRTFSPEDAFDAVFVPHGGKFSFACRCGFELPVPESEQGEDYLVVCPQCGMRIRLSIRFSASGLLDRPWGSR